MKKSVLAVAIAAAAFAASAASAAQVYDKDGTTLAIGGQIEFMAGNAGNGYFGNNDATTRDRARLTMAGRTQLTSGIAAYAYNEWQVDHSGNSLEGANVNETSKKIEGAVLKARQQFVGVDFGNFGKVQMGRYKDPFVFASSVVDVLDEVGIYGGNDERNSGHLSYMWKGFGFDAGVSYQFAEDDYATDTLGISKTHIDNLVKSYNYANRRAGITDVKISKLGDFNVDSGFSVYTGYTSVPVVFGPISIRAAYQYLKGQGNSETNTPSAVIDNLKTYDVSLAWGTNGKGFYVATNYNYSKASLDETYVNYKDNGIDEEEELDAIKTKAWETVATYGFENGIRVGASYHWINVDLEDEDGDRKFVQLIADYNVTPNFKLWAEALFDAGSDDGYARLGSYVVNTAEKTVNSVEHNSFMVGARYVF